MRKPVDPTIITSLLAADPRDRVMHAHDHPVHYNLVRRDKGRLYTDKDPIGFINGDPLG